MKIKPVIGKELFKRLEAGIQADDLTSDEKELLNDYIADALINFIMADLPYRSKYKFSNVGFMEMTAENTTPVPGNEVDKVVSYYANKASFYANRITEYLDDNRETFPLYKPNCNNSGQYNTGIYLG